MKRASIMNNAGKPYLDFDMDAGAIQKELKILIVSITVGFQTSNDEQNA